MWEAGSKDAVKHAGKNHIRQYKPVGTARAYYCPCTVVT